MDVIGRGLLTSAGLRPGIQQASQPITHFVAFVAWPCYKNCGFVEVFSKRLKNLRENSDGPRFKAGLAHFAERSAA